jgi:hypothetical protein
VVSESRRNVGLSRLIQDRNRESSKIIHINLAVELWIYSKSGHIIITTWDTHDK